MGMGNSRTSLSQFSSESGYTNVDTDSNGTQTCTFKPEHTAIHTQT